MLSSELSSAVRGVVEGVWPSLAGRLVRERKAVIVFVSRLESDYKSGVFSSAISHNHTSNAFADFVELYSGALLNRDLAIRLLMRAEIPKYIVPRLCSERRG